ncbi:Transglutaminase-like superfamily protein [Aquiflexum balticum DSM 16537]|uniref:Transglutaminase-like superfamily protein n=1 Tax=Aquiflexum balticum DSM 16537 TaxID=758820 RepID=A0A1W2H4Z1_9BACT|nr:DUF3857 domain-containing protein [Aquiflexum balticum]SMD44020.1 Transglutaminase-like superfamily protein [Aquiflexum balticum DSM 16537]
MKYFSPFYLFFGALICLCTTSYADIDRIKFGKVPDDAVLMKVYENDLSADAVVLSHIGFTKIIFQTTVGFQINYQIHKVVKIITKDGVSQSDLQIPYYNISGRTDQVGSIKGFVYNEVNGKIVKEKIEKVHVFDEAITKTYKMKKISPPNVTEGSVIEIYYEISSDLFSMIREWEFQSQIPTMWSEFTFEYPEYFLFNQANQGYVPYTINDKKFGKGTANWSDIERTKSGYSVTTTQSTNSVSYSTNIFHWAIENAPAMKQEPYIDNPMSYATKVEFQLESIQFPNSQRQIITGTWDEMSKELLNDEDFGRHLTKSKFAADIVTELIKDGKTDLEKTNIIMNHLGDNVKWDGRRGIYPSKALEKVYKEGKGSYAEINLLLTLFLREAGIEAHPIVSSTRDLGFLNPSNPVMYKLNCVTSLVKLEDKEVVLDATDPALPIGFLPINTINMRGWAILPNGSKWVDLVNSSVNVESAIFISKIVDESVLLNVQRNNQGYKSAITKSKIISEGNEKHRQSFQDEFKDWELLSLTLENVESKESPITEKFELKGTGGIIFSGDLIYFNPFENMFLSENPFKLDSRVFPIDFIYPQKRQVVFGIEIPEGYVIDEMPKSLINHFADKGIVYSFRIASQGDQKIQIMISYQVNETMYKPSQYKDLREFFDLISQKQKESIVLKKI